MELTGILRCLTLQPGLGHHYNDKGTEGKDEFHDLGSLTSNIHATEGLSRANSCKHNSLAEQQSSRQLTQHTYLALALMQTEVGKEHNNQCENQQGLGNHI